MKALHKSRIAALEKEFSKQIEAMERSRNDAQAMNAVLRARTTAIQSAAEKLSDRWAIQRVEYELQLGKLREELSLVYTVRNTNE